MVAMSPTDVRDRLDDRFRLLSGSRRGLERHQTLRHAVQWSYDLLDADERAVLNRCSVFAGGFDLAAAVAVAGQLDEYTVLDLLMALVRKSLLTADQSRGRARYGLLETIRQFAEEQLAAIGESDATRNAHARYYAGQEPAMLELWNSPNQRDAYDWLDTELANLRSAFRWATDRVDLDTAATIATYTAFIGFFPQKYEPITWAEELLDAARAVDHRRLAMLLVIASTCVYAGRSPDTALGHSDAALAFIDDPRYDPFPFGHWCWIGLPHIYLGRPDTLVDLAQREIERTGDPLGLARSCVVFGLVLGGRVDEAMTMAGDVVAAAEAVPNPASLAFALFGYGIASRFGDPLGAINALRRGLVLARESGNTMYGVACAMYLAVLEAEHGDRRAAFDLFAQAISSYHDAGDTLDTTAPMAGLAVFLRRIGRHEPAAITAGYTTNPLTLTLHPEHAGTADHLRDVLGSDRYETLTRQGAAMKPADAVRYAFAEIELARAELDPV
jgi:tetratricopeptide (TPR) repeat protein